MSCLAKATLKGKSGFARCICLCTVTWYALVRTFAKVQRVQAKRLRLGAGLNAPLHQEELSSAQKNPRQAAFAHTESSPSREANVKLSAEFFRSASSSKARRVHSHGPGAQILMQISSLPCKNKVSEEQLVADPQASFLGRKKRTW